MEVFRGPGENENTHESQEGDIRSTEMSLRAGRGQTASTADPRTWRGRHDCISIWRKEAPVTHTPHSTLAAAVIARSMAKDGRVGGRAGRVG